MGLSYKEELLERFLKSKTLNESLVLNESSIINILLEAPIPDNILNKMIDSNKRFSIYYKGDDNLSKGWHKFEPVSIKHSIGKPTTVKGYVLSKSGGSAEEKTLNAELIVNWNILSNTPATFSKDAEDIEKRKNQKIKKSSNTSNDTSANIKIPDPNKIKDEDDVPVDVDSSKEVQKFINSPEMKKSGLRDKWIAKLKNLGIRVGNFIKKAAIGTALAGSLAFAGKDYIRKQYPHITQYISTENLTNKNFNKEQLKYLGTLIKSAIDRTGDEIKGGVLYKDYPAYVDNAINKSGFFDLDMMLKQAKGDIPTTLALTLGRFIYKKQKDGSYIISDPYDFSRGKSIKSDDAELKNLSYTDALQKIMKDNKVNLYVAMRHMKYLESPEDAPEDQKKVIRLVIPKEYVEGFNENMI